MDVDLELASFVDGRVEEGKKTLRENVSTATGGASMLDRIVPDA